MHLYISRHAQSYANVKDITGEHSVGTDPALTELGCAQARALGERLSAIEFDAIFASPSHRALATANEVAIRQKNGPATVFWLTELSEVDRTGKSHAVPPAADLLAVCPTAQPYPKPGPLGLTDTVPGDDDAGLTRAYACFRFLYERYTDEETKVLVIAHGVFNSRFISAAMGGTYPFFCRHISDNAMLSCISYLPDLDGVTRPLLRFHNDVSHLLPDNLNEERD